MKEELKWWKIIDTVKNDWLWWDKLISMSRIVLNCISWQMITEVDLERYQIITKIWKTISTSFEKVINIISIVNVRGKNEKRMEND